MSTIQSYTFIDLGLQLRLVLISSTLKLLFQFFLQFVSFAATFLTQRVHRLLQRVFLTVPLF